MCIQCQPRGVIGMVIVEVLGKGFRVKGEGVLLIYWGLMCTRVCTRVYKGVYKYVHTCAQGCVEGCARVCTRVFARVYHEIGWQFLFKGLPIGTWSYFDADATTQCKLSIGHAGGYYY